MKLHVISLLTLILACVASSAESRSARDAGQRDYAAGEFKRSASHFQHALQADPNDAASAFWLGKSYEMLADIGGPLLGTRASFKAGHYLAQAFQLSPDNNEYRRELFEFLIACDHSPGALRRAESIIQMTPESDPDYPFMLWRLHEEHQVRSSPEGRITSGFSALPEQFARITR